MMNIGLYQRGEEKWNVNGSMEYHYILNDERNCMNKVLAKEKKLIINEDSSLYNELCKKYKVPYTVIHYPTGEKYVYKRWRNFIWRKMW